MSNVVTSQPVPSAPPSEAFDLEKPSAPMHENVVLAQPMLNYENMNASINDNGLTQPILNGDTNEMLVEEAKRQRKRRRNDDFCCFVCADSYGDNDSFCWYFFCRMLCNGCGHCCEGIAHCTDSCCEGCAECCNNCCDGQDGGGDGCCDGGDSGAGNCDCDCDCFN